MSRNLNFEYAIAYANGTNLKQGRNLLWWENDYLAILSVEQKVFSYFDGYQLIVLTDYFGFKNINSI
jgi:hypothetical protein